MLCAIAGGNWNNSSNAGVWNCNWNNARTNSNDNVGVRADSPRPRSRYWQGGEEGGGFRPSGEIVVRQASW